MHYELYYSNKGKLSHYIYLDVSVFRILKREPDIGWDSFFELFDKNNLEVISGNINFLFTWSQVLEIIGLGQIISTKIKASDKWKKDIANKSIFKNDNIDTINNSLDKYFNAAYDIIVVIPELQKHELLNKLDYHIQSHKHHRAEILIESTLLKARNFIVNNGNYIKDLANDLAWNLLTANPFIISHRQWIECKDYFDPLIAGWHDLFLKKNKLNLYRLIEQKYFAYTNYSKQFKFDPLNHKRLKYESDLCDSELIDFAALGHEGYPVIGITFDAYDKLENRLAIMKQFLIDAQRDIEGWKVNSVSGGKIISLKRKITDAHIIPFDAPFRAETSNQEKQIP